MATISLNTSLHSEEIMLNGVLTLLGCDSSNKRSTRLLRSLKLEIVLLTIVTSGP